MLTHFFLMMCKSSCALIKSHCAVLKKPLAAQEKVWIQDKLWRKINDFHAALWGRLIISVDVANRLWLWATSFCQMSALLSHKDCWNILFFLCAQFYFGSITMSPNEKPGRRCVQLICAFSLPLMSPPLLCGVIKWGSRSVNYDRFITFEQAKMSWWEWEWDINTFLLLQALFILFYHFLNASRSVSSKGYPYNGPVTSLI